MSTGARTLCCKIGSLLWVAMHPKIHPVSEGQKIEDKSVVNCISIQCRDFLQSPMAMEKISPMLGDGSNRVILLRNFPLRVSSVLYVQTPAIRNSWYDLKK